MGEQIKWDQSLNIGNGIIDNQHKIILDLFVDLERVAATTHDKKALDTLFDVIENTIFRHFEDEEELFRRERESLPHQIEHYELIKSLHNFRFGMRTHLVKKENSQKKWNELFIEHIKKHDIPLFGRILPKKNTKNEVDNYPVDWEEKRRYKRIPKKKITDGEISTICYNTTDLKNSNATIVDISIGGVRICSSTSFQVNDLVIISCIIGTSFKLREKVRIRHVIDGYYGAEFVGLSPVTEQFLNELYGSVNITTY